MMSLITAACLAIGFLSNFNKRHHRAARHRLAAQLTHPPQWNVTPFIGDFGGRVGIYSFLQSHTIPRRFPSLFSCRELFSFCPFTRVPALIAVPRACKRGHTLLKGRKENNSLQLKREGSVQGIGGGGKKLLQVLLEN